MGVYLKIFQANEGYTPKNIEVEITIDDVIFNTILTLDVYTIYYLTLLNQEAPSSIPPMNEGVIHCHEVPKFFGFEQIFETDVSSEVTPTPISEMLQCRDLTIRVRMVDIPGMMQEMSECLWYESRQGP